MELSLGKKATRVGVKVNQYHEVETQQSRAVTGDHPMTARISSN